MASIVETNIMFQTWQLLWTMYQHPNRLILVAGPEILVRPVATRALAREDAQ